LGLADLPTVTRQLTYLADSLVQTCLTLAARQSNLAVTNFAVIAMGKLGVKNSITVLTSTCFFVRRRRFCLPPTRPTAD